MGAGICCLSHNWIVFTGQCNGTQILPPKRLSITGTASKRFVYDLILTLLHHVTQVRCSILITVDFTAAMHFCFLTAIFEEEKPFVNFSNCAHCNPKNACDQTHTHTFDTVLPLFSVCNSRWNPIPSLKGRLFCTCHPHRH